MKTVKKLSIFLGISLLFIAATFMPPTADAATFKSGENVNIAKNQTVNDTLFTAGSRITIDADVNGDIFCAGEKIQINGRVDGDVICAAQEIIVNGQVSGDIRAAGEKIVISAPIARNVMIAAKDVTTRSNIERELFVTGETLNMQGTVAKKLYGGVDKAVIAGSVGEDVNLEVENLEVSDKAKIGGNLNYTSQNQAKIANGNVIAGDVNYEKKSQEENKDRILSAGWIGGKIFSILGALAIALLAVLLWPKNIERITNVMKDNLLGSVGFGILVMFLVPIISVILMVTLIGLPLGILLLVIWGIALYLSRIFVAVFIGRKLLESFWKSKKDSIVWSTVVGVIVTWIAFATPFIGGLLSLIAMWMGLGGIFYVLKPSKEPTTKTKKK